MYMIKLFSVFYNLNDLYKKTMFKNSKQLYPKNPIILKVIILTVQAYF